MTSGVDQAAVSTAARDAPAALLLRLAGPWAGFALVMAVAAAKLHWTPELGRFQHALVVAIRGGVAAGGLEGYGQAAAAFAVWLAQGLVLPLAIYAAFLMVEIALAGPPKRWAPLGFAVLAQMTITAVFIALPFAPGFGRLWTGAWGPMVRLEQGALAPVWPLAAGLTVTLASLVFSNFFQYWMHRAHHAVPLLWRFHRVHHSVEAMDSLNSYTHPLDSIALHFVALATGAVVGFQSDTILWVAAFLALHDRLLHTRAPINFGPLGWLFVDNRFHFVHHSVRPEDVDCNFSAFLTIWDRLFGTFRPPRAPHEVVTGLAALTPPRTLLQMLSGALPRRQGG